VCYTRHSDRGAPDRRENGLFTHSQRKGTLQRALPLSDYLSVPDLKHIKRVVHLAVFHPHEPLVF
jgi:hypothetical protein